MEEQEKMLGENKSSVPIEIPDSSYKGRKGLSYICKRTQFKLYRFDAYVIILP